MQKDNQEGGSSQSRGSVEGGAGAGNNNNMGGGGNGGRGRGNAANLSREARVKGGQRSAQVQVRDEHGQFAGRSDKSRSRDSQGGNQGGNDQARGGGGGGGGGGGESTPGR